MVRILYNSKRILSISFATPS